MTKAPLPPRKLFARTSEPIALRPEQVAKKKAAGRVAMKEATERAARAATKERITIYIDKDVLAEFRASGLGWQTRMNDALRKSVGK